MAEQRAIELNSGTFNLYENSNLNKLTLLSDCAADNQLIMMGFHSQFGHEYVTVPQEKKDEYKSSIKSSFELSVS
jgi:hypothetical protein